MGQSFHTLKMSEEHRQCSSRATDAHLPAVIGEDFEQHHTPVSHLSMIHSSVVRKEIANFTSFESSATVSGIFLEPTLGALPLVFSC